MSPRAIALFCQHGRHAASECFTLLLSPSFTVRNLRRIPFYWFDMVEVFGKRDGGGVICCLQVLRVRGSAKEAMHRPEAWRTHAEDSQLGWVVGNVCVLAGMAAVRLRWARTMLSFAASVSLIHAAYRR